MKEVVLRMVVKEVAMESNGWNRMNGSLEEGVALACHVSRCR